MEGWYHSLKEGLSQIRLTIKQTLPTSNRNTMNETPVPCRKNTAIRLHYWLPDEDSDRDWHTEGDQGIQKWTEKKTTIALTYWVNFTGGGAKCALNFQKLPIFILGREFKRGKVLTNVQDSVTVTEMLGTVLYLSPAPLFLQQEPKGPLL